MRNEHTPGKWKTTLTYSHIYVNEGEGHDGVICKMPSKDSVLQWACEPASTENSANACFIVKACNSHDELLAALQEIANLNIGKEPPSVLAAYAKETAIKALTKVKEV